MGQAVRGGFALRAPGGRSRTVLPAFPLAVLVAASLTAGENVLDDRPSPLTHGIAPFQRVIRSLESHRGRLWVGTYGSGLFEVDLATGSPGPRHTAAESWLTEDRVNGLASTGERLWIGTCKGVDVLGPGGFERNHRAGPGSVAMDIYHVLRARPDGGVWVGTTGKGLSLHRGGVWTTFATGEGLLDGWVNDVAEHRGSVFVATGTGLYSAPLAAGGEPGRFGFVRAQGKAPPGEAEITALASDGPMLWVATMKHGLYGIRSDWWFPVPVGDLPHPTVHALVLDREGVLWIGTRGGLASYRLDRGFRVEPGFADEEVKVLHVDPQGGLWIGTFSGKVLRRPAGSGDFTLVLEVGPGNNATNLPSGTPPSSYTPGR